MSRRKTLKLVHFASTAWFMLCVGYILVLALRQAGFHWWIIFSLSGHSALVVFLLISLYLFAVFRGIDRSQKIETEHPLTSTGYYTVFYDVSPFLGGLAGCLGMIGVRSVGELLTGIALGTLGTTFLVWIIVDPAIGLLERLLPASREHRLKRLARIRALRQKRRREQNHLLAEIEAQEQSESARWGKVLRPDAERLVALLAGSENVKGRRQAKAVDIGVNAWQMGGLNCMRQLHSMVIEICKKRHRDSMVIDYVSSWWDGIGSWRSSSVS